MITILPLSFTTKGDLTFKDVVFESKDEKKALFSTHILLRGYPDKPSNHLLGLADWKKLREELTERFPHIEITEKELEWTTSLL